MPKKSRLAAVACSDLHLSHRPPLLRSAEPDWYAAMQRTLEQLETAAGGYPIIYAGDIFDHWDEPAQLINFAIQHLPHGYAIPGQHDLPLHNLDDIKKSAFWTLVEAGKLTYLKPDMFHRVKNGICLYGMPWGCPITACRGHKSDFNIAVVHAYCWFGKCFHPGADADDNAITRGRGLRKFDVAIFGDNHQRFIMEGKPTIVNCGTFMRRKADELKLNPALTFIYEDRTVRQVSFDTSTDVYIDTSDVMDALEKAFDMTDFVDSLGKMMSSGIDFFSSVKQFIKSNGIDKNVKKKILEILEESK